MHKHKPIDSLRVFVWVRVSSKASVANFLGKKLCCAKKCWELLVLQMVNTF